MPRHPAPPQNLDGRDYVIRQVYQALERNSRIMRASLPQFYSLEQLCDRYQLSREKVTQLLAEQCGYRGRRGVSPRIPLRDVLILDQVLEGEIL